MEQISFFHVENKKQLAFSKLLTLLFTFVLFFSTSSFAQVKIMYAVVEDGTATFYYDHQRSQRSGIVRNIYNGIQIFDEKDSVTKVIVDTSFSKARPESTAYWFSGMSKLEVIADLENLNTSQVTDMSFMFSMREGEEYGDYQTNLASLDVGNFDTSNVTSMAGMFRGCTRLTSLDVSHFDTSNVTNMRGIFSGCRSLTSLDVSHFDTSNVTDMAAMFSGCRSLTSLDVSHFDTSNVTNMAGMFDMADDVKPFYGIALLANLDVSHFDTRNVTNMYAMFAGCRVLRNLDVSHFDTSNVTDMGYMFECCGVRSLDLSHFDTSNVTNMTYMFEVCGVKSLDLSHFDTSSVTSMIGMFSFCGVENLDIRNFDTRNARVSNMFSNLNSFLTNLTIGQGMASNMPSLSDCKMLSEIISYISEPVAIPSDCFAAEVKENAKLNVYVGAKSLYKNVDGWKEFKHVVEKIVVPSKNEVADFGNGDINEETDLNGNTIGNIYFSIGDENGEYSSAEGCIVLKKSVADGDMDALQGKDIFGEDFNNGYTGLVFMVQAGSGAIKVKAESIGNMTLKVKIGKNAPTTMKLEGKMETSFPYSVTEPTYVYVYGGGEASSTNARPIQRVTSSDKALKLYGIEWIDSEIANHVESIAEVDRADGPLYNLNGQRLQSIAKGIVVKNGKKYMVR